VPFVLPDDQALELGVGTVLRDGVDALFIGYGPTLLSEGWRACDLLLEDGFRVGLVSLPWLNHLSPAWLMRAISGIKHVFSLDNHHTCGGQGDRIADVFAAAVGVDLPQLHRFAVEGLPACGAQSDVLRRHGLDTWSLRQRALRVLPALRAQLQAFPNSFEADTGL
jgi:transketolase